MHILFLSDRQCFGDEYNDIFDGVCVPCSDVCLSGCTGANALVGDAGCNRCYSVQLYRNGSLVSPELHLVGGANSQTSGLAVT